MATPLLSRRALLSLGAAAGLAGCGSLEMGDISGFERTESPQPLFTYYRPAFPGRHTKQVRLNRELLSRGMALGNPIMIRVFKESSELEVWMLRNDTSGFDHVRTYPICAFSGHLGPKLREGDLQSPEGFYQIDLRHIRGSQLTHLFMELDFPNALDRSRGRTGSWLGIHGGCSSIGCYAITDRGIEELFLMVEAGLLMSQRAVPVHAFPFRMELDRLAQEKGRPHFSFWQQLQPAYAAFQETRYPPRIGMLFRRYVVRPVRFYDSETY